MATSKHWGDPEQDAYADDDGNILYHDKQGKLRKFKATDVEYQQMYHYHEEDN
jgi:hypothetical protein